MKLGDQIIEVGGFLLLKNESSTTRGIRFRRMSFSDAGNFQAYISVVVNTNSTETDNLLYKLVDAKGDAFPSSTDTDDLENDPDEEVDLLIQDPDDFTWEIIGLTKDKTVKDMETETFKVKRKSSDEFLEKQQSKVFFTLTTDEDNAADISFKVKTLSSQ